jgi:hypothetical protein
MSKTKSFAVAGLTLLGTSMHLSALTIATRGLGQVLEFPYYTVNANQNTLITVVNSTQRIKALKARFREGYDGRVVAQFNVYLSPYDVWTGAILSDNGAVAIATRDNSCTVPAFSSTATSVDIPALALSMQNFTGASADTGPTDASRLNEGHFEFFEMGEITGTANGFDLDIEHVNGVPPGCAQLVNAWAGGVWSTNAATDMTPPGGGLFGSEAIVDVANGTFYSVVPTVLDGFSSTVQHTAPSSAAPDFDTMSAGNDGKFGVSIDAGGKALDLHYAKSVDAVSALFMANQVLNEYETLDSVGAQSDWQVTFPTKHFYVAKATGSSPPFEEYYGQFDDEPGSCVGFDFTVFDREEEIVITSGCTTSPCSPGILHRGFCYETDVVSLSSPGGSALHSSLAEPFGPSLTDGHMNFDFGTTYPDHKLAASVEGTSLRGLPVVGFLAENFVNANVTPGVLANYTAAIPHHSTVACATANGACP